jgi:GR25 family glycosyltransferase involved in LPS biosynthesis
MRLLVSLFLASTLLDAALIDHLHPVPGEKNLVSPIKNIDYIYLINLDARPEKLESSRLELSIHNIPFHRFPAVCGWELPVEALRDLGVNFQPGMLRDRWVVHFPVEKQGHPENEFLRDELVGEPVFARWTTPGSIGCTLSHLSILQDAYEAGYETIWVMEDDISVQRNPHELAELIEKLDQAVGKEGWDILYTDHDKVDAKHYAEANDFESDLKGDLWFFWRPDRDLSDRRPFAKRSVVANDFVQIGSRYRTHSMVIRRSGIEKILNYEKSHPIFLPYDQELATIPDLKLFNVRESVVTVAEAPTDTQPGKFGKKEETVKEIEGSDEWVTCVREVLDELPKLTGWRDLERAHAVMELVHETKPALCVEIGAFGGTTTYPIAAALKFLGGGIVHAIDAWETGAALEGIENLKKRATWSKIDMTAVHAHFLDLVERKELKKSCIPVQKRSSDAAASFEDCSIDMLVLDGNSSKKGCLEDVITYFPKVKEGGYIWLAVDLNDGWDKLDATSFLMKQCSWIKEKSVGIRYLLFKKRPSEENQVYNGIKDIKNPTVADFRHVQSFLTGGRRESLTKLLDTEKKLRSFRLIGETPETEPQSGMVAVNADLEERENCLVLYASYNWHYPDGLWRIVKHVQQSDFRGHIRYWVGGWPNLEKGDLSLAHVPHGFKASCIKEAERLGYKRVLWLDCSILPLISLNTVFKMIQEKGYLAVANYHPVGPYSNPEAAAYFGFTQEETDKLLSCQSGFIGLDLTQQKGREIGNMFYEAAFDKSAYFTARSDQTVLSLILHRLKCTDFIELTKVTTWRGDPRADLFFLVDRPYVQY